MRTCDGDDDASATADDGGGATDGVVVWERRSGRGVGVDGENAQRCTTLDLLLLSAINITSARTGHFGD